MLDVLKVIITFIILIMTLGLCFNAIDIISEKKIWRIVNTIWGYGLAFSGFFLYPVVLAFQYSNILGFQFILLCSAVLIGGLVAKKIISSLLEKLDEKFEKSI